MLTARGEHSKMWLLRDSISSMQFSCCAASPTSVRSLCTPFAFRDYQACCPFIRTQVFTVPLASRLSIAHTGGWEGGQGEETRTAEISPWIHYSPLSLIKRALLFECNICFISVVQDQGPDAMPLLTRHSQVTVTPGSDRMDRVSREAIVC